MTLFHLLSCGSLCGWIYANNEMGVIIIIIVGPAENG